MSAGIVKNKKLNAIDQALKTDISKEGNHMSQNLTPERIAEIVKRINENFYDREDVLQVVAERILKSPELQSLIKNKLK
jgi:DNA polymerase III psi subunit